MLRQIFASGLLVALGNAADLAFHKGDLCTAGIVYSGTVNEALSCYNLDKHLDVASGNSTSVENIGPEQTVLFYSDSSCQQRVYNTTSDVCYGHSDVEIWSFQVVHQNSTANTTDVALYNFALSDSVDLVPTHEKALSTSTLLLGVFIIRSVFNAASFASTITGCATTGGAFIPLATCITSVVADVGAYVCDYFIYHVVSRALNRYNAVLGQFVDARKRDPTDAVNEVNEWYMASLMNMTEGGGAHVGYMERDVGSGVLQTSPVYKFAGQDGNARHMTAFYDHASGDVIHSFLHGNADEFEKRATGPGYKNVRWDNGGVDFEVCQYNDDADRSVFGPSKQILYREIYQDLRCLGGDGSYENAEGIALGIKNGAGTLAGDSSKVGNFGTCGKIVSTIQDQSCVF